MNKPKKVQKVEIVKPKEQLIGEALLHFSKAIFGLVLLVVILTFLYFLFKIIR